MFKFFSILIIFLSSNLFANVAKVVALNGNATVIREGKSLNLEKDFIILKHDEIKTHSDTNLQLFFKDETIITIGEKSSFQVYDYLFDEKDNDVKAEFSIFKGTFKTITGRIGKIAPQKFILKTKSASIGIRGTQIHLDLNEEREIISCTEGIIIITLLSSGEQIVLKAGESLISDIKSKQVKRIDNGNIVNIFSLDDIQSLKIDRKYDNWIEENDSIRYSVEDAFYKGHKVEYNTTQLEGTIFEKTDGETSFNTSNATFDLTIDFGKDKNDNPVEGFISIDTATSTSKTQNLIGNINDSNQIEMTYDVKENEVFVKKDATGTLEFKNNNLDVIGKDIEVRSYIENEKIIIDKVQFEPK